MKEQVVVTGTFEPVPLNDVDRSVSTTDMRDEPLLYNHWIDYLQSDPSIDLGQRAPNDVQTDISIRGSSFGQTLVLINGLRVNDVQTGHHDMDLPLPTDSIDRIEVMRGAGSTLYGSDAIGGAVNFITLPPLRSEIRVAAGVGNFGINQESLSGTLSAVGWSEQLSVSRDFSTGFAPDRDYRSLTVFSATTAKTLLGNTMMMLGYGDKPFGAGQFYGDFDSWERTKTWFAGLRQDLGQRTEFGVGYRRHTDEFILLRDDPQVYENNHVAQTWDLALRRREPLRKNATLFYGAEGSHDAIESNNLGQHSRVGGSGYVDLDVRALSRFSFSLGARQEWFDSNAPQFNPSVAGGVWLRAGLKLKGSASRGFRLPSYTDLYYTDPATVGNPNLKPESAWSYEVGLEWNHSSRWKANATVFELREQNVIDHVTCGNNTPADTCPYTPPSIYHAANIERLNFTGVETSAGVRLSDVQRITLAYTWLHGEQRELSGLVSRYVFHYPIHSAVIEWQATLPGMVLARSRVGVTERFAQGPYAVWDADVGRTFGNLGTRLSLSNLTNTGYEEIQGVSMPGRSVVFGLEYTIRRRL